MSKQASDLESHQPVPSAPPSYDQSEHSVCNPQMMMPNPPYQYLTPSYDQSEHSATNPQMMMPNPPYQYQPVPLVHEMPLQAPQQPNVQTHIQYQVVPGTVAVGPHQVHTTCPHCRAIIKTKIETDNAMGAHLCCFLMCLLGCCLCSCIPYCMDGFKIVKHTCPNCKAYLGTYKA